MDSEVLLSICIPTYNRGLILDKTLETYVNDPAFDERVEIVISDNCSSDSTEEKVLNYTSQYKNIIYRRLPENIGPDLNMSRVLSLGRGLYLKLMNDTVTLKSGILKMIIDTIGLNKSEMKPIFFYQNISFLPENRIVSFSNLNELVKNISFEVTWISNFGIWRKDFEVLDSKDRLAYLQFPHTDWTFRVTTMNKSGIIYFGDYYNVAELNSKGGYNVFYTFGVNYLSLYNEYIKHKLLDKKIFETEKYRLFRYFLTNWYKTLVLLRDSNYTFKADNAFITLLSIYKYEPYFYISFSKLYIKYYAIRLVRYLIKKNE